MKNKIFSLSKKGISIFLALLLMFSVGTVVSPIVAQAVTSSHSDWCGFHRFTVNNKDAFCIHFDGDSRGSTVTFKTDTAAKKYWKNLGTSKQNKINKIITTANELGYLNSNSNAKYFAIQRAIWKITDGNRVENLKSSTKNVEKFKSETQKYYDKLVATYPSNNISTKPNISTITLNETNNYVGKGSDKNKVLSDWTLKSTGSFNASITGNTLEVDGSDIGNFSGTKTITLKRSNPVFTIGEKQVGRFNDQEAIMTAGAYTTPTYAVAVQSKNNQRYDPPKGALRIKKVDENGTPIAGVKFTIKWENPKVGNIEKTTITTDENGVAITSTDFTNNNNDALLVYKDFEDISKGKIQYSVVESEYDDNTYTPLYRIEAVTGITLNENEIVDVSNDQNSNNWVNVSKKGDIKVVKEVEAKDGSNVPGEGFEFILTGTGNNGVAVNYESKTNHEGIAYFCNVPVGTYQLSEKSNNIYLETETQTVDIEWDEVYTAEEFSTNEDDFQASKTIKYFVNDGENTDEETDLELEDATAIDEDEQEEDIDVEESEYTGDTSEYVPANTYKFVNKYRRGDLKIVKTEEYIDEENPLNISSREGEGFEFSVKSKATDNITGTELNYSVTTGVDGVAYLNDIPVGTYTVKEVSEAPYFEKTHEEVITIEYDNSDVYDVAGFENINSTIENFDTSTGTVLNITNKYIVTSIKGTKTDPDGEPLEGVVFGLYTKDDTNTTYTKENALKVAITDENGEFEFNQIPYGEYYVVELSSKEGYVLTSEPILVNATDSENPTEISVTNELITGTIQITKTDATTGKVIPNCKIEILDADKNVIEQGVTDEKGVVEFTLTYGTYYYREYEAPKGYILDTTPHMFKISKNGQILKAVMTNDPEKKTKTTKTGDSTFWIILAGSVLIVIGCTIIFVSKRKLKK